MKTTIKLAMAAALLAGASSFALAQTSGSTAGNAAASGGPGTHQVGDRRPARPPIRKRS